MKHSASMRVGVVVERRRIDNPWQDHSWRPIEVVPGAPDTGGWKHLYEEAGNARYLAGGLTIELFPGETTGYRYNLSQERPAVYVILRRTGATDGPPLNPFHVTVSPDEAQEYLDSGEDLVEGVPMPEAVAAWVQAYVREHHREVPFEKRKRKRHGAAGGAPPDGTPNGTRGGNHG